LCAIIAEARTTRATGSIAAASMAGMPWIKSTVPALPRNQMQEVRLHKPKLLEIIRKNREEHHAIFLEAQKKYREVAIKLLDRQLAAAREGKPFVLRQFVELVQPVDHTADYDRAIQMLELSVDDVTTLTTADFANLVQDQWQWTRQWAMSNSRYVDSPKLRSLQEG
jgi:hypothetical protein